MDSQLSEESIWASGLAARVRLIQSNFSDDAADVRRGYVTEEIERALASVSPTRRKVYLTTLAEKFPAWDGVRSSAVSDVKTAAGPLQTEDLIAKIIEVAPTLSAETRTHFAKQLKAVGLSIQEPANANVAIDLPPELQKRLGIAAGKPLQAERAAKLLVITAEFTLALDQLAWALWRQLAPKSAIRKETEFNRLTGPYLTGDGEVSAAQLAQPVEKTRRLIAGLLGAIGRAGSSYAKKHTARLSPEAIEDFAKMEKKTFESIEAACWRKFVQQSREHATEMAIENELQEAIAKAAENLIAGRSSG
jgi:hypothetical protein